jgi:nucleotide-binding universal stress UspA family protein
MCLVLKELVMVPIKNILVPLHFSEFSDKTFQYALDTAILHKAKIFLFHVNEAVQQCAVDYCIDASTVERIEKESNATVTGLFKKMIGRYPEAKEIDISTEIKIGSPSEEILKEQQEKNIDLIVIASHKKRGKGGSLFGGVADNITRSAKCPVMVIR